jgi:SpoVK/Ycf46/Vps4 family AAA+-type ATPase
MLGRALPAILNHPNFISASGPDLGSVFSGGTEAKLKEIFERAKKESSAVLFIDEIDILCSSSERAKAEVRVTGYCCCSCCCCCSYCQD